MSLLLELLSVSVSIKLDEHGQVGSVQKCGEEQARHTSAAVARKMQARERDQRAEAHQKLDDLSDSDGPFKRETDLEQSEGIVGVHDDVDGGVEDHAVDGDSDSEL